MKEGGQCEIEEAMRERVGKVRESGPRERRRAM